MDKKTFNMDRWLWDRAYALALDSYKLLVNAGGGTVALFYKPTTESENGTITVIPGHVDAEPGYINGGVTIRGNLTRDQTARLYYEAMRRFPILPLEVC